MNRQGLAGSVVAVAVGLLVATAALGDATSDYEAGVAAHGRGDLIIAMELLQRAADEGHVAAMLRLAAILDGAERNGDAFALYLRAAEAGSAEAFLALGVMYANGEGVERNSQAALDWMTRAAEAGHGPATVTLGQVYGQGQLGVAQNQDQALRWLQRGVDAGYAPALRELERLRVEVREAPPR